MKSALSLFKEHAEVPSDIRLTFMTLRSSVCQFVQDHGDDKLKKVIAALVNHSQQVHDQMYISSRAKDKNRLGNCLRDETGTICNISF